jgi:spore coat protein U-like protein
MGRWLDAIKHFVVENICRNSVGSAIMVTLVCWLLAVSMSQAGTATASLTVQMTITTSCTINAGTLTFPSTSGSSLQSTAATAATTVSVTCGGGAPYSIGMDNGANYSAGARRMTTGGNYVGYGLYIDPAYTYPWTTSATNSTCTVANDCYLGTGSGSAQSINIYGQVPVMATAPAAGTYTDTVTMTITY